MDEEPDIYDVVDEEAYEVEKDDELRKDVDSDDGNDEGNYLVAIDSQGYHLCPFSATDDDLDGDGELEAYKEDAEDDEDDGGDDQADNPCSISWQA